MIYIHNTHILYQQSLDHEISRIWFHWMLWWRWLWLWWWL